MTDGTKSEEVLSGLPESPSGARGPTRAATEAGGSGKWTPGEWSALGRGGMSYAGTNAEHPCFVGTISAPGGVIVSDRSLLGVQGRTPEEAETNARLIAAAPDLYEALAAAEDKHQRGIFNMTDAEIERVTTLRRAALAKATGA